MRSEKLQSQIIGLREKYNTYISNKELLKDFEDGIKKAKEDIDNLEKSGNIRKRIEQFTNVKICEFLKELNISFLSKISGDVIDVVYNDEDINFSELCLSKNPEYVEIQRLLRDIYVLVEKNQREREKSHHYIGIIRHALSYVKSCERAFETFIDTFQIEKKEKKSIVDFVLLDVKSIHQVLNDIKNDLTGIGEVITSRHNLLLRNESSIRLLSKYVEQENFGNRGQSRNSTTEQGGGYNIE